jgi:FMN phosphatase YigB (HAD superfamily)
MRGTVTSEQIIGRVAQNANLSYDTVYAEFVRSCQSMKFVAPEVPLLVAALRGRGVRVVIATDNMDSFGRFTVPAMGLSGMFDEVLNSSDLKALKDDFDAGGRSLFFHDYMLKRGMTPEQYFLIDDSESTRASAERIGIGYLQVTAENTLVHYL